MYNKTEQMWIKYSQARETLYVLDEELWAHIEMLLLI